MRSFAAVLFATAVLASSAASADTATPLPAGKPAGVQQAQMGGNGLLLLVGIGIVAGGIALVASQGNNSSNVAVTTTGTAP